MSIVLPWVITCTVTVGAAFCLFLFGTRLEEAIDDHDRTRADLAAVKLWIAENFGGPEPRAVTDPATVEAPAVDVVGGLRKRDVAAAREANRERPTPFPRQRGRH